MSDNQKKMSALFSSLTRPVEPPQPAAVADKGKGRSKGENLCVRIEGDLLSKCRSLATRHGIPLGQIIRTLLANYIAEYEKNYGPLEVQNPLPSLKNLRHPKL